MRRIVLTEGLPGLALILSLGVVLTGCPEDKDPGFADLCSGDDCGIVDVGGDAMDMGEAEFVDNPECPGSGIVINEIMFKPPTGAPEWIEIIGPADRDLTGFRLVHINGANGADIFDIPLEGTLGAAGRFLISETTLPGADQLSADLEMQNDAENVLLLDCSSQVVDAVGYGNFTEGLTFVGEGSAAPNTGTDESLARCPGAPDTNDNSADFFVSVVPTPDAENDYFEDPFSCVPCVPGNFADVVISEVFYTGDVGAEFVELYATAELDLFGLSIAWINGTNGSKMERSVAFLQMRQARQWSSRWTHSSFHRWAIA